MSSSGTQQFGGQWTEKKLDKLRKYMSAYTTIMSKQPTLTFGYIDAFAGTGYRETEAPDKVLIPDDDDAQRFLKGSVQIALETEPPFNGFVFIERDPHKVQELEKLREKHPGRRIRIVTGDANEELRRLADGDWRRRRAVLFLDPFGLQVEWKTLEAIAATQALDVWILFPLGVGVNRLLTRSGEIAQAMKERLDSFFGTSDWYQVFYKKTTQTTLFGQDETIEKVIDLDGIADYFNGRLAKIFAGVAPRPLKLKNRTGNPLFLLCFGAANTRGAPLAVKIAQAVLDGSRKG